MAIQCLSVHRGNFPVIGAESNAWGQIKRGPVQAPYIDLTPLITGIPVEVGFRPPREAKVMNCVLQMQAVCQVSVFWHQLLYDNDKHTFNDVETMSPRTVCPWNLQNLTDSLWFPTEFGN